MSPFISIAQLEYYASNRAVNSVNKYDESGVFIEEIISENAGGLSSPQDIVFHPDGSMLVASSGSNSILKFDRNTGDFIEVWNQDPVTKPTKMSIGPDNLLYVTQWGQTQVTSRILKFNLDGTLNSPLNIVIPTPLAMGHVWDDEGNFYAAFFGIGNGNGSVHKFDPSGNSLGTFIDNSALQNPTYIWWDTNSDMMVEDFVAGKVLRYDSNGNYIEDHITGLSNPEGFGFLPSGNLIVVERTINQITEFDTNGNSLGQWDSGIVLNDPNFLVTRDPNLSILDNDLARTIVIPSVGSTFQISSEITGTFKYLNVYNSSGALVENIVLNESTSWNANRHAEGLYILTLRGDQGIKYHQKVIVKKR